jgi:prepilin-type N-terminal cleavage/methylation domain-containing protein
MNRAATNRESRGTTALSAFTLIELLVVISIIGVLAALIIPLSGVATTKMRIARVKAELNQYVTAIESYKAEVGSYPPDSFDGLRLTDPGTYADITRDPISNEWLKHPRYNEWASTNALFYELTGAIFTNRPATGFKTLSENEFIPLAVYTNHFKVSGLQNSARNRHDVPYKAFSIKAAQFAELASPTEDVEILNVPVPGPFEIIGKNKKRLNPWRYDASTSKRHNKSGFDLWAEIIIGRKQDTIVIGNWKN